MDIKTEEKPTQGMLLWGFCDRSQMIIINAESMREAIEKAEKFWVAGQTITPLGALPVNAPALIGKPIFPFDHLLWHSANDFFYQEMGVNVP